MKYGRPLRLKNSYWTEIEREINRIFFDEIYRPLLAILKEPDNVLLNDLSLDPLVKAISDGVVWYEDGLFHGDFNAKISRRLKEIGARFNAASRTWSLPREQVPAVVSIAKAHADARYTALSKSLLQELTVEDIDQTFQKYGFTEKYDVAIQRMNDAFEETVSQITIPPSLTPEQRANLSKEYSQNLQLYIKDWSRQNILSLREQIEENAFRGQRAGNLVKLIQKNYGVSQNKARFLARQETALLMSQFHEQRYKSVGVTKYKWGGVNDGRERPDHVLLNGTIQSFSSPPVVDRKTGRRANAGEDYNCRCVAIPVFDGEV